MKPYIIALALLFLTACHSLNKIVNGSSTTNGETEKTLGIVPSSNYADHEPYKIVRGN
jgi:hypothetical protein